MISFIAMGSNIEDREQYLTKAIEEIGKRHKVLLSSSIYETEPVGYADQSWFLNAVIQVETEFSPEKLLEDVLAIEEKLKRVRVIKNGPRTMDLDILFYQDQVINTDNLIIPHPRLHERAFVLVPLNEIAPDFMHPILKKSVASILKDTPEQEEVLLYKKEWIQ